MDGNGDNATSSSSSSSLWRRTVSTSTSTFNNNNNNNSSINSNSINNNDVMESSRGDNWNTRLRRYSYSSQLSSSSSSSYTRSILVLLTYVLCIGLYFHCLLFSEQQLYLPVKTKSFPNLLHAMNTTTTSANSANYHAVDVTTGVDVTTINNDGKQKSSPNGINSNDPTDKTSSSHSLDETKSTNDETTPKIILVERSLPQLKMVNTLSMYKLYIKRHEKQLEREEKETTDLNNNENKDIHSKDEVTGLDVDETTTRHNLRGRTSTSASTSTKSKGEMLHHVLLHVLFARFLLSVCVHRRRRPPTAAAATFGGNHHTSTGPEDDWEYEITDRGEVRHHRHRFVDVLRSSVVRDGDVDGVDEEEEEENGGNGNMGGSRRRRRRNGGWSIRDLLPQISRTVPDRRRLLLRQRAFRIRRRRNPPPPSSRLEERRNELLRNVARDLNARRIANGANPISVETLDGIFRRRDVDFTGEDYDLLWGVQESNGVGDGGGGGGGSSSRLEEVLRNDVGLTPGEISRCPVRVLEEGDDLIAKTPAAGTTANGAEEDEGAKKCVICLDPFRRGDTVRTLSCFHTFHKECIDPWLLEKPSCPICKHHALG